MRIHRFSRILALLRYPCNSIHETNEFHPRNVSLGRLCLYQIYLRKDYWQIFWSTYLDDSVVCTPQFKAMLVRIRPAGLKQQRAFRVWQIAIRTWEKYNIPHAVRWWSSKVFGILGVDPGVVSWVGKEKRRNEILQARAKKLENFPRAFSSSDPANDCPWVDSKNEYFVAHLPCVDDANERKILDAHQVLFACTGCLYSMSSIRLIDHWRSYFSHDIKTKLLTLTIQKLDHRINSSLYVTSAELWFWRFIYLFNREEKYDVTLPW